MLWAADEFDRLNARITQLESFARDATAELECLNTGVTSLESFARELWEHDRHSMHVIADDPLRSEYNEWARRMIVKARELGIEERNDA